MWNHVKAGTTSLYHIQVLVSWSETRLTFAHLSACQAAKMVVRNHSAFEKMVHSQTKAPLVSACFSIFQYSASFSSKVSGCFKMFQHVSMPNGAKHTRNQLLTQGTGGIIEASAGCQR